MPQKRAEKTASFAYPKEAVCSVFPIPQRPRRSLLLPRVLGVGIGGIPAAPAVLLVNVYGCGLGERLFCVAVIDDDRGAFGAVVINPLCVLD